MSDKIAYVVHPVTSDQKKELRQKGFKILDARFAPEGEDTIDLNPKASKSAGGAMKVDELKSALVEAGVEIPEGAKKGDLQALYDEHLADKGE